MPALGAELSRRLTDPVLEELISAVPDDWLTGAAGGHGNAAAARAAYLGQLRTRREGSAQFIEEAIRARASRV